MAEFRERGEEGGERGHQSPAAHAHGRVREHEYIVAVYAGGHGAHRGHQEHQAVGDQV